MGLFGNVSKISAGLFTSKLGIRNALICLKLLQIKIMCSRLSLFLSFSEELHGCCCVCVCVGRRERGNHETLAAIRAKLLILHLRKILLSISSDFPGHKAASDLSAISTDSFEVSTVFCMMPFNLYAVQNFIQG